MLDVTNFRPEIEDDGFVELMGLWKAGGEPSGKRPVRLLDYDNGALREFVSALQEDCDEPVYRWKGHSHKRKVYAHPVLALEYARRIEPRLAVYVNRFFLLQHPKASEAVKAAAAAVEKRIEPLEIRFRARLDVASQSADVAFRVKELGGNSQDIIAVQARRYLGLYLMTAAALARKRGVRPRAVLDHMGGGELGFHLSIMEMALAAPSVDTGDLADSTHRAATRFREMLVEFGVIPEDAPAHSPVREVPRTVERLQERLALLRGGGG